ncbi:MULTISPECIES: hypothetical protein [Flavobacterium]|jgi:hypothetical protein|uniref:Uncharacterized protein n=1 Tax=Flavobacterium algoritolerans TaxID=3041254 RepID=A0ABT6VD03_9FLAO|nr:MULTISPECIES: hypothetical protein [Flavobacterium]MDI5887116.1 hypothetical protein [Flavobacterium yafengii]MDI5896095.1 hypothetical protein [Flavobacterium algoritolerans]
MKKIIALGLLLFMTLFSHTSKIQSEQKRNIQNKYDANEKQLIINRNDYPLNKFDDPIKYTMDTSAKQRPIKHFSRHRKGKIIYIQKHKKINTLVLE